MGATDEMRLFWSTCVVLISTSISYYLYQRYNNNNTSILQKRKKEYGYGFPGLIGHTPLIELKTLSALTGCTILGKAEFLNPGGSSKDRVAKGLIEHAETQGLLNPNTKTGVVVEGTSGSTGISLALMCQSRGYKCIVVMPDDQALEKRQLLTQFGAHLELVPPASIVNTQHYVNVARQRALEHDNGFFVNQFENEANFATHYATTGPEIWEDTHGELDAFVMSAGTGGTIAGVSRFLKEKNPEITIYLADPPGSSLFNKVEHGVCYSNEQSERKVRRHRYDTVTEGIGLDRITANFSAAEIDQAVRVSDAEAVDMSRYLLKNEGLFLGGSSAVNCVAAVAAARALGPGHTIVTILCDSGQRHLTKFWNDDFLKSEWNLHPDPLYTP